MCRVQATSRRPLNYLMAQLDIKSVSRLLLVRAVFRPYNLQVRSVFRLLDLVPAPTLDVHKHGRDPAGVGAAVVQFQAPGLGTHENASALSSLRLFLPTKMTEVVASKNSLG